MKILVVDDSSIERRFLERYLGKQGHQVLCAENGSLGVAAYAEAQPDLVLLDMSMPDMDGREVVRQLRAQSDEWVPIIFLSGMTRTEDIEEALDAGGDDYLTKPFQPKILDAKIRSMQRIAAMREKLVESNRKLTSLAELDGLTGLPNRRRLDQKLGDELARCARNQAPLSAIMIDIDHFKRFNDTHGHLAGDECLRQVAVSLAAELRRPADLVGRYGGEEFCAVLPETPAAGASSMAEQMRARVSQLKLQTPGGPARVTVSLGVATLVPKVGDNAATIITPADTALYTAKGDGRNLVRVAQGVPARQKGRDVQT